ncbi:CsiV family protein [Gallaecimonas pentaromativorans]|uniref:CsiV family protein n=1 Tax=Gallaecimonas pentaromativorans TaxID=584787 RepID=UPI003A8F320E
MQKLLKGWVLLTALVSSQLMAATVFDVEVVIVARQDASNETWPPRPLPDGKTNPLLLDAINAQCPPPCAAVPQTIVGSVPDAGTDDDSQLPRLLRPDELKLNDAASRLTGLPGGRVLLHTGWRLAPKQPRYATPMAVEAGRDLGSYVLSQPVAENTAVDVSAAPAEPQAGEAPVDATVMPAMVPELAGQIQVALDHYLLVDMALDLKTVQGDGQPLLVKTLRQKRRLKSGEWHYFDNPAMGVLMQIRPVR